MSKAFTKETDADEADLPEAAVPAGVRNLITPAGLERLRAELRELRSVERPKVVAIVSWAAGNGDRSENGDYIYGKRRLREIDSRMHFLSKRIQIAEPVDPAKQKNRSQVFFGATVTYTEAGEPERTVRIVGIDEVGEDAGDEQRDVSWISPIAKALLRARERDVVELRTPSGPRAVTVRKIEYPEG